MTLPDPHRRQFLRRSGAALTAIGSVGLASTTATAETGQQGILAESFPADVQPDYRAFFGGYISRYASITGPPEEIEALATDARNEFNANSELWVSYGNWLLEEADVTASGDTVVAVEFALTRGRWPTADDTRQTAIDVGYNDTTDEFESLEWRDEEADEPDFQIRLENRAAENAADELSEFRRQWIGDEEDDHELPDDEYINSMAGKYADTIGFGSDSETVLELFFGEVNV